MLERDNSYCTRDSVVHGSGAEGGDAEMAGEQQQFRDWRQFVILKCVFVLEESHTGND